ncbi:hypothetical protein H2200_008979 [Cladophialophora chaetospira]|uniref:RNA polymerase II subunit B1 CTD phosphatase RPAP2 homolog n=1 Tax=Cladophialophora chaetospira TaxID=386627 RepID=A0AA39CFS4_9EURO|nr:hypothetical protein H2200_008979 [Cladophialophora chaetospira]
MATETPTATDEVRIRATALRQARDIEDRKKLQGRVADLVVDAFELPSKPDANPAKPQPSDASLFRRCLSLFQSSDLDDLIRERNIDNRCGYALCPNPNLKVAHGGEKVWNHKGGKDFKLVDRADLEKWCSKSCQERTAFVRAQLGTEPAWLRVIRAVNIKLLDEVNPDSLVDSLRTLAIAKGADDEVAERMQALALERGDLDVKSDAGSVEIMEKTSSKMPQAPTLQGNRGGDAVEGHQPRKVRFSDR